jgi:ribosomal protein L18E
VHNVNDHAQLEEEYVLRIKRAEGHEKTHGSASICQLVKNRAKLGTLVVVPGKILGDKAKFVMDRIQFKSG